MKRKTVKKHMDISTNINIELMTRSLENVATQAARIKVPEANMKPCTANILTEGVRDGVSRTETSFFLATEMNRMDFSEEKAYDIIIEWNSSISEPLAAKVIRDRIKSAYKVRPQGYKNKSGKMTYGCNNPKITAYCDLGKDNCPYYIQNFGRKGENLPVKGNGIPTFAMLDWWTCLSWAGFKAYCGICKQEQNKGVKPGCLLIVNIRQLARVSKIGKSSVGNALEDLSRHGLLCHYKKGTVHKHYKNACEVKRTIPIPRLNSKPNVH